MPRKSAVNISKMRKMIAEGADAHLLARTFGVSRQTIYYYCNVHGLYGKGIGAYTMGKKRVTGKNTVVVPFPSSIPPPPPSPAMIALAQFDPVIRRALRLRQGVPPDDVE